MRVVVVGPGAMGCLFGARLAASGVDVFMLDRDGERAARIAEGGLVVEGARPLRAEVAAGARPEDAPEADLVLVTVKSYHTRHAAESLRRLPGRGHVLTLQNGLGNAEILADAVGQARLSVGATSCGATKLGVGRVRQAGEGPTRLAPWIPHAADGTELAARLLRGAGFEVSVCTDPKEVLWRKLVVNAAINATSAVADLPNGRLAEVGEYRELLLSAAREAAAVAAAAGVDVPDPEGAVLSVCKATAENISSMLQDIRCGRRTEVEAINGAIVAEGRRLGVATPVSSDLLRAVRFLHKRSRRGVEK